MVQSVGETHGIIGERRFRAQIDRAVGAPLDINSGRAEGDRAQRMAGGGAAGALRG